MVSEKAGHKLLLMRQQGLSPAALFWGRYLWHIAVYVAFMAALWAFGAALGLDLFVRNSPGVQVSAAVVPWIKLRPWLKGSSFKTKTS